MAISALSARLGIATEITSAIISKKESLSVDATNGPPPSITPQIAKPARVRTTVAVSRGPHHSAAQTSGSTARNPSEVRCTVCMISGLKPTSPTRQAPASATNDRTNWVNRKRPNLLGRPQHHHRSYHQSAGDVAEPPREPDGRRTRPVRGAGQREAAYSDRRAEHRSGQERNQRKLRNAARRLERTAPVGPQIEEAGADQRFERVAERDGRGRQQQVGGGKIGDLVDRIGGKCPEQNCRPDPQPEHQHATDCQTGGWPDRCFSRVNGGQQEACARQHKVGGTEHDQGDDIFRHPQARREPRRRLPFWDKCHRPPNDTTGDKQDYEQFGRARPHGRPARNAPHRSMPYQEPYFGRKYGRPAGDRSDRAPWAFASSARTVLNYVGNARARPDFALCAPVVRVFGRETHQTGNPRPRLCLERHSRSKFRQVLLIAASR